MPGLLRGIARTAVVAGTATAVSGRVQRRQAERYAERDASIYAQQDAVRRERPTDPVTPDQILAGSHTKCRWRCDAGQDHAWQATVENRTRGGRGCPCCAGFQELEGDWRIASVGAQPSHACGRRRAPELGFGITCLLLGATAPDQPCPVECDGLKAQVGQSVGPGRCWDRPGPESGEGGI
jgi:hypothetical protein